MKKPFIETRNNVDLAAIVDEGILMLEHGQTTAEVAKWMNEQGVPLNIVSRIVLSKKFRLLEWQFTK